MFYCRAWASLITATSLLSADPLPASSTSPVAATYFVITGTHFAVYYMLYTTALDINIPRLARRALHQSTTSARNANSQHGIHLSMVFFAGHAPLSSLDWKKGTALVPRRPASSRSSWSTTSTQLPRATRRQVR
jgi:hypothetical protein